MINQIKGIIIKNNESREQLIQKLEQKQEGLTDTDDDRRRVSVENEDA